MTLLALGLTLAAAAAWDLAGLIAARQGRAAVVVGGFWAVAMALALIRASGVEPPSAADLLIRLVRPVSRWVP